MRAFVLSLLLSGFISIQGIAQINVLLADTLQHTLDHYSEQHQLKGVAAAVTFPDGSQWSAAYGHYGSAPLHTDLLYEIGSNTKTFVAVIMLQMHEEGLLSLDDPLGQFITPSVNISPAITLRQLLNHTSGIYNYTDHPDISDAVLADMEHIWNIDTLLARFVDAPSFEPGMGWEYSNTNYLVLGKVIEAMDSKPFHESLRQRILQPMALNETFLSCYENLSLTHVGTWLSIGVYFNQDFKSFMSAAWAAGGMLATPEDLANWAFMLYGGQVLDPDLFAEMTDVVPVSATSSYGLGMFERIYNGHTYYGHGGTTLQHSEMDYSRETGFSCVTMVIEENTYNEARAVQNALIDVLESEVPKAVSILSANRVMPDRQPGGLHIFPNPAGEQATLSISETCCAPANVLVVYDGRGKEVKRWKGFDTGIELLRSEIGSGVFYAVMYDEHGNRLGSGKVVFLR